MKTPKLLSKLSAVLSPRPKKKLQATARVARQTMEDYDAEEPTTKLSSAFVVVLILHLVAVGGIYAFNSIKASRRDRDIVNKPAEVVAPVAPVAAKNAPATAKNAGAPNKNTTNEASPAHSAANAGATAVAANRKVEAASPAPVPAVAAAAAANTAKAPAPIRYEVKANDNLTKIAFSYKVTAAEIMAANQLKEGAVLRPGQQLTIPPPKTAAKTAADAPKTAATTATPATAAVTATPKPVDVPPTKTTPGQYTVKKGDTLTSIAKNYGSTLEELSKLNKITDPKKLQLGQVLKLPPRKG